MSSFVVGMKDLNQTATSINKSISESIGSALDDLTTATGSLSDIFTKLLYNIANSIRKAFVDDLTSRITKSLGLDGSGGVGGYLADVLARGPSGSGVASVPGVAATATSAATTAATAATDAATAAAEAAAKTAETAAVTAATGALGTFAATVAAAPTGVVTSFAVVSGVVETVLLPVLGTLGVAAESAAFALASVAAQQTASSIAGFFHEGGIVGSSSVRTRSFPSSLFAGARRMHSGGVVGLQPDEVPTILQKGEAVLTKNQQEVVNASLTAGSKSTPMNIRNVLVTDPNFVSDAMASSQGEKVLMTFIQRNRASIRQSLG